MQRKRNIFQKPCKYGNSCRYGIQCKYLHENPFTQFKKLSQADKQSAEVISDEQYQQQLTQSRYVENSNKQRDSNQNQKNQKIYGHRHHRVHHPMHHHQHSHHKYSRRSSSDTQNSQNSSNSSSKSDKSSKSKKKNKSKQRKAKKQEKKQLQKCHKQQKQKQKQCKRKKGWFNFKTQQIDQKSYQQYSLALKKFFCQRNIKPHKCQSIIEFLTLTYPNQQSILEIIIPIINQLEKESYCQHYCYKKLFKTIVKQNFDCQATRAKLQKKMLTHQKIKQKRNAKDSQFFSRFPNPANIQFLQSNDLLYNQMANKNTIYLIDGNNCLVTEKHLRFYFQSPDAQMKAQAQLRFIWLISLVVKDPKRCFIFFDDEVQEQVYDKVVKRLLTSDQYAQIKRSHTLIYPQKGKRADDSIRDKLKQICQKSSQKQLSNIIIISADRMLVQQCNQIHFLRKSSGMYLLKFCKKYLKEVMKKRPFQKHIIKRILAYPQKQYLKFW